MFSKFLRQGIPKEPRSRKNALSPLPEWEFLKASACNSCSKRLRPRFNVGVLEGARIHDGAVAVRSPSLMA